MAKSRSEGMFANSTFPCVLCVHGRFSLNLKEIMYKAGVLESLAGAGVIGVCGGCNVLGVGHGSALIKNQIS